MRTVLIACATMNPFAAYIYAHRRSLTQRMRVFAIFAQALSALTLVGCAAMKGYPERSGDPAAELQKLDKYFAPDIIDQYDGKTSETERRAFRDEVVNGQIRTIDLHFNSFVQSVSQESVQTNLGTDVLLLGLNGAGAVVAASTAKTILASIAEGVTGTKTAIDKNVFFEKTMPALVAQMEADRKTVLVSIRTGLTLPTDKYSLFQALVDLDDYYIVGTIPGSIAGITKTAGASATASDRELKDIVVSYKADAAGAVLRSFWKPDGKTIDKVHETTLRNYLKDNGLDDLSITTFIIGDKYSDARSKAVLDLKIGE